MPRKPRLYLPGYPQHIVVRGHNCEPILARHEDFQFLYRCVKDAAEKYGFSVHAWVFMHNHIHLLGTPSSANSLPSCMQSVGRRYAQYFNRSYHRSGALWEGRYKSMLIDGDSYLLTCYRYIELNPVRAGITRDARDYPYSSYASNALGKTDEMLKPHDLFCRFIEHGREAYVALLRQALSREELTEIRRATSSGLGVGKVDFMMRLAKLQAGLVG
ncbi:MAG: transposase, partial [Gammaproteobacteria bacterium]|nr:transposase [Gammaproteobacteria bacterium]